MPTCLVSLSQFISRLGEKGLPLYRLLRKTEHFTWTPEALNRLKASLTHAPILTPPTDGEPLFLYVAATTQVVSAVIMVERQKEGHVFPSNDRCTTSAKCCPKLRHAIHRFRSCSTQWFWLGEAAPLLRGPSRHRGLVFPFGRDSPQQGGRG